MELLYPSFLYGLFAVSIPIAIHLFNLQKPQNVSYSNIQFLKTVQQKTSQMLKLKHLLILLTRILFITFLVIAFCQPIYKTEHNSHFINNNHHLVYIDNSYSTQNEIQGKSVFDYEKDELAKIVEQTPKNHQWYLLDNDLKYDYRWERNQQKMIENCYQINFSGKYTSFDQLIAKYHSLTNSQKVDFYIFSDFQKNAFSNINKIKQDTVNQYFLFPITQETKSNISIDSVWVNAPIFLPGTVIEISVKVNNKSTELIKNIPLKLKMNQIQVGVENIDLNPNEVKIVDFKYTLTNDLIQKGFVEIKDQPVVFDNEYFFNFNILNKINVYHLYGQKYGQLAVVYQNNELFNFNADPIFQLDINKLNIADVIILESVGTIEDAKRNILLAKVKEGKSLIYIPSTTEEQLDQHILSQIGCQIKPVNIKADSNAVEKYIVSTPDYEKPFFNDIFLKKESNIQMPYAVPSIELNGFQNNILNYKNGLSQIASTKYGKGIIYAWANSFNEKKSNFNRHALLLPILYKMSYPLNVSLNRIAYFMGESPISLEVKSDTLSSFNFQIKNSHINFIPAQKLVDQQLTFEIPGELSEVGYYDIVNNDNVFQTLAINNHRIEGDFEFYTVDELEELFKGYKNVTIVNGQNSEVSKSFYYHMNGFPLWKYFIILAIACLIIEILLKKYYHPAK